jgi:regulator of protease activity HflC (stomatin/prohibitin superfamily)
MFEHHQRQDGTQGAGRIAVRLLVGCLVTLVLFMGAFSNRHSVSAPTAHSWPVRVLLYWAPALMIFALSRLRICPPAAASGIGAALAGGLAAQLTSNPGWSVLGGVIGAYLLLSIKVANQWQKCVVLRFGRYRQVQGPGLFHIIPFVDQVTAFIDERVQVTAVHAEAALTRDTVPVNVDAVIFWVVWDAGKATLEVQDYDRAVALTAQTALLQSIGRHDLGSIIAARDALGRELRAILEEKTAPWGITLQSVEIRDIHLPAGLEDALSRQAQAERERQARITLADSEVDIAAKFVEASVAYRGDPVALHLRAMNMLFEVIKEKGSMVVVPAAGLRRRAGRAGRGAGAGRAR